MKPYKADEIQKNITHSGKLFSFAFIRDINY